MSSVSAEDLVFAICVFYGAFAVVAVLIKLFNDKYN